MRFAHCAALHRSEVSWKECIDISIPAQEAGQDATAERQGGKKKA